MPGPGARPKSTSGPSSARSKPPGAPKGGGGGGGGGASPRGRQDGVHPAAKPLGKQEAPTNKQSATAHRPVPPRMPRDGSAATGAGEDVGVLKATGSVTEGCQGLLARVDEEIKGMTSPSLILLAELCSRYSVLVDILKDVDVSIHPDEVQFVSTLAHRQADVLKTVGRQSDMVRSLVRAMWSEGSNVQALLEQENTALVQKLKDCTADLELERVASSKARTSKAALDCSVKQMRAKIKDLEGKMESKAAEDEAKLKEQVSQVHTLKEKLRARGVVLEQRTKELEAKLEAAISELQSVQSSKQELDTRLGSVTQTLQIETQMREKAERRLKETSAKLSQMEMIRVDADLDEVRAERDKLKAELEELTAKNSADLEGLRRELKRVMEQLEARSRQLDDKDAELRHYLALRPGEPSKEEVEALKKTLADLVSHNELLEQELSHCREELAQRDVVIAQRDKVMAEQENVTRTLSYAQGQSRLGPHWPQELQDGRRLIEMDATLQRRAVKCKAYEQTIRKLEEEHQSNQKIRIFMEKKIAQLEHLLLEVMSQAGKQGAPRYVITGLGGHGG
ncbi:hypothetical protein ONE63_007071 [Megalurothrips usitatus]|uniref:Uncharacterized protein n=1 Tax=Megalurothrips usitatus TaxID=439358 RepID=A0AAV7XQV3_9NEOP|nr:hypothetical protein ONE63_007071 [Megalurothrips usitatus]